MPALQLPMYAVSPLSKLLCLKCPSGMYILPSSKSLYGTLNQYTQ